MYLCTYEWIYVCMYVCRIWIYILYINGDVGVCVRYGASIRPEIPHVVSLWNSESLRLRGFKLQFLEQEEARGTDIYNKILKFWWSSGLFGPINRGFIFCPQVCVLNSFLGARMASGSTWMGYIEYVKYIIYQVEIGFVDYHKLSNWNTIWDPKWGSKTPFPSEVNDGVHGGEKLTGCIARYCQLFNRDENWQNSNLG